MELVDPRKHALVGRESPYAAEFRNDAVALYRAAGGKRTYAAIVADVGVSGETLRSRVRQVDEPAAAGDASGCPAPSRGTRIFSTTGSNWVQSARCPGVMTNDSG